MEPLQWNESLSVGIREIDDDHKNLLVLLATLQIEVKKEASPQVVERAMRDLMNYTQWHFRHEERLMQTHRYPGYRAHKTEHGELISQVEALHQRFVKEGPVILSDAVTFLKNWLANHILRTDKSMGQFLKNKL
jgi:hemerythrin-like metal-binding protein